jgi:hypothetical protein
MADKVTKSLDEIIKESKPARGPGGPARRGGPRRGGLARGGARGGGNRSGAGPRRQNGGGAIQKRRSGGGNSLSPNKAAAVCSV